ncbi:formin-like protein 18 isoform X2 [Hevea brasiliensis]|uniref:formin-like protein 18 isoform X2 n=1 Tax=Hevea brasiliensis TaxID=3981 RepID=UPI0025D22E3F|nr:formin-like protein 18 isoform X2 [Hevea brasiliensis]
MALFRKFFYRKPPDGLFEISERVYDILEDDECKVYIGNIVSQLRDYFPDSSFMVFNFREGENQSQIGSILSEYDMTVMDYPRHYEGCPLLTMEMIHHFLKSSESWLSLVQQNVLLMHCEQGGWPVLAFMLAALLIYRKQFTGEQKTLDMIYKQAPRELLQLMSPLNPLPSQLRYLQYVSRRNVGSQWPPLDRALTLDCVILRVIPNMNGEGGCRPIFRIYGQDPLMVADQTPKVLFSRPKRSKLVRHYKQEVCDLIKIDIHCHIQGDVVMECISVDSDLEREHMMFRVMFNTAFIRSNILMLNRDEIDTLWNVKDQFPKDFRAEVLFSEMDSISSRTSIDLPGLEEKGGLPEEAFAKVQEIFSNVDWLDTKPDVALNVLQHITTLQENLEAVSPRKAQKGSMNTEKFQHESKLNQVEKKSGSPTSPSLRELSVDANSVMEKVEPQEPKVALQWPAQSKILSSRVSKTSRSSPYHSTSPTVGISALLHDHAASNSEEAMRPLTLTSSTISSPTISSPLTNVQKSVQLSHVSHVRLPSPSLSLSLPPPPPPPSSTSLQCSIEATTTSEKISAADYPPPQSTSKATKSSPNHCPEKLSDRSWSLSGPATLLPSPSPQGSSPSAYESSSSTPPPPPPPSSFSGESPSPRERKSFSPPSPSPPPPPPPPPPPSYFSRASSSPKVNKSFSTPPPPPPPSFFSGTSPSSTIKNSHSTLSPPPPTEIASLVASSGPPPPPPPPCSGSVLGPSSIAKVPPPPPPPSSARNSSNSSACIPPVPPPPAPFAQGLSNPPAASSPSPYGVGNGNVPPVPGPPSGAPFSLKGRGLSRPSSRSQVQPRKANLKPYHWLKLTRAMQGSLWAETQKSDEASKAPEFDMSELESLFSAAAPTTGQGGTGGKSNRRTLGPKSDKVQLIELRRAYNCEIMLSKVKIPLSDLMSSVLAMDDSALDVDQVDNLIKFCPTKEEMELLKGYNGDKENLGKCEQFFLELMKVPRVESKLRVFSFKLQFHPQVSDLRRNLNVVNSAAEEIRSSVKLKRIMQTILSLGNALNHGTARGSAIGFRLDSLLKLTDTRARNNKMTLMHYLCKVLAEKLPELLDFPKDLMNLEAVTKIQLKYLAEEMQAISKGLEKVVQELTASENDGQVSENFCMTLKAFLSSAESEVRSLASLYSTVGRNADALALYFGEDPARCPFEQVVSTLLNFVRMFVRAHEENCKQLEFEKKKAEREAENERLKVNGSKKESENLMPTPIKSGNIK